MKRIFICIILAFTVIGCYDYKSEMKHLRREMNLVCIELGYNYCLAGKTLEEANLVLFDALKEDK